MLTNKTRSLIEDKIGDKIKSTESISGGCISDAFKLVCGSGKTYFLKLNSNLPADMFPKEANGLSELRKSNAIRIPEVFYSESNLILIEFIKPGTPAKQFFENFGRQFAALHNYGSNSFGFYEDNYIGANEQKNIPGENEKDNWIEFYINKRIMFQVHLAEKKGHLTNELSEGINKLTAKMDEILSGSEEPPALLHGDLWSGNFLSDEDGNPCLIDPAVYYGHREADIAMTKLFGGFDNNFYASYNEAFPLKDGYKYRENVYKLYHVLNHLNLFGGGYYSQTISLIKSYL